MITLKEITKLYQAEKENRLGTVTKTLWNVATEFNAICQKYTGTDFDNYSPDLQNDTHKDYAYFQACYKHAANWDGEYICCNSPESLLMYAIDHLFSGIHTVGGNVTEFVTGAPSNLLDLIFEWDGNGLLYDFVRR